MKKIISLILICATLFGVAPILNVGAETTIKVASNHRYEFSIQIPVNWNYEHQSDNGDGFVIDCGNTKIDMSAFGSYDTGVFGFEDYMKMMRRSYPDISDFTFNNGSTGYLMKNSNAMQIVKIDEGTTINFYIDYARDTNWYEANKDIVLNVAKSLNFNNETQTSSYQDDYLEMFGDCILMYVDSPRCYVYGDKKFVDPNNHNVKPFVTSESRTLVPVRFISESLNWTVDWNASEQLVTIIHNNDTIKITLGEKRMFLNNKEILLDSAAITVNNRTFVPIRALAEALGQEVYYLDGLITISPKPKVFNMDILGMQIARYIIISDLMSVDDRANLKTLCHNYRDTDWHPSNVEIIPSISEHFNANMLFLDVNESSKIRVKVDGRELSSNEYTIKSENDAVSVNGSNIMGINGPGCNVSFYYTKDLKKFYEISVFVSNSNSPVFKAEKQSNDFNFSSSGLAVDNYFCSSDGKGGFNIRMDIYNPLDMYGAVEVYDENFNLLPGETQRIEKFNGNLSTSIVETFESGYDLYKDIRDGELLTYKQDSAFQKTSVSINVPTGGFVLINTSVNNSDAVAMYNAVSIAVDSVISGLDWTSFALDVYRFTPEVKANAVQTIVKEALSSENLSKDFIKNFSSIFANDFSLFRPGDYLEPIVELTETELKKMNIDLVKILVYASGQTLTSAGESILKKLFGPFGLALDGLFNFSKTLSITNQAIAIDKTKDNGVAAIFSVPNDKLSNETSNNTSPDVETFNGHNYKVFDLGMTWCEAQTYCESLGGYLVTITSQEEQDFVFNLIKNKNKNHYWLGATDEIREGDWKWVTGESFSYTNWDYKQPDNGDTENYLQIYRVPNKYSDEWHGRSVSQSGKWNDVNETATYTQKDESDFFRTDLTGFICEWNGVISPNHNSTVILPSQYPPLPSDATQKYYVIFAEGFRNGRLEITVFDMIEDDPLNHIVWNGNLRLKDHNKFIPASVSQYYASDGEWIKILDGYSVMSDRANEVYYSNLDVRDRDGNLIIAKSIHNQ